ncbi:choice-of-anchor tandem repeat GloVer-containing protein [Ekhidna sp.]|uniref:choice-of-anchor tandem repeat GloVer-containing protein n=1 Tax=Ekhidna sp. TaxID=2608089 RepID=UPI003CCBB220
MKSLLTLFLCVLCNITIYAQLINKRFFLSLLFIPILFTAYVQTVKVVGMGQLNGGGIFAVNPDGSNPENWVDLSVAKTPLYTRLIESNNRLWGMSKEGGKYGLGTVFSVNSNGEDLRVHHSFETVEVDGVEIGGEPTGSLIESNGKLWGMDSYNFGSIFTIDTDGTNFQVVLSFSDIEGSTPNGSLFENNGVLWGMTTKGGSGSGTIFTINPENLETTTVHTFDNTNGQKPIGNLISSNEKLWGMTSEGGSNDLGVIFTLNLDGSNFTKVHDFDETNGSNPFGTLIESNGKLWGMTTEGGSGYGVIFSLEPNGSNFKKEHSFNLTNGAYGFGDLIESNGKLWGLLRAGGENDDGVLFSIDSDGSNFLVHHHFNFSEDGSDPYGSLTLSGDKLWGITSLGGRIFTIENDGSSFKIVKNLEDNVYGSFPNGSLLHHEGMLWGMTSQGGVHGYGTIFKMNYGGKDFVVVHDFDGSNGSHPFGNLVENNGELWGMTSSGGSEGKGVIFSFNIDDEEFNKLHDFNEGRSPRGNLTLFDDQLWGMTRFGGSNDGGTLFTINADGTDFTIVHNFQSNSEPEGDVTASNGKIYGATTGGAGIFGTLFSINSDGTDFNTIHLFNSSDGNHPVGKLLYSNGKLWGMTSQGGSFNVGVVFNIEGDGTNFTIAHHFNTSSSRAPQGSLVEYDSKFWGLTSGGNGSLFHMDNDGNNWSRLIDLEETGARQPFGSPTIIEITRADPVITFSVDDFVYGDENYMLTASSTNSDEPISFISSDPAVIDIVDENMVSIVAAGTVTLTASQEQNDYFNAQTEDVEVNVEKASLSAIADDQQKTYGQQNPSLTISYEGFVNNDNEDELDTEPTASTSATESSNVGNYTIEVSEETDNNYAITPVSGQLTVSSAPLTAKADDKTIIEGDPIPELTISYEGFVLNDGVEDIEEPSISTEATSSSEPGTYDIVLSSGTANNYILTLINGTLTIMQALGIHNGIELTVYPNPITSGFKIKYPTGGIESVSLFSLDGREIKRWKPLETYSISELEVGIYTLVIRLQHSKTITETILKE